MIIGENVNRTLMVTTAAQRPPLVSLQCNNLISKLCDAPDLELIGIVNGWRWVDKVREAPVEIAPKQGATGKGVTAIRVWRGI